MKTMIPGQNRIEMSEGKTPILGPVEFSLLPSSRRSSLHCAPSFYGSLADVPRFNPVLQLKNPQTLKKGLGIFVFTTLPKMIADLPSIPKEDK